MNKITPFQVFFTSNTNLCSNIPKERKINLEQLRGADLRCANLNFFNLTKADFSTSDLRLASFKKANLQGANLQGANLQGANLQGANLQGANLQGAYITKACLKEADLHEANLHGAHFNESDLTKANLNQANLSSVYLTGACLSKANLTEAWLHGSWLYGVDLNEADLTGAYYNGKTHFQTNFNPISAGMEEIEIPTIEELINTFNYLSQYSNHYFGNIIVVKYWNNSCPNIDWLKQFQISDSAQITFIGSSQDPISISQLMSCHKWVNAFVQYCSEIIENFTVNLDRKKLFLPINEIEISDSSNALFGEL